jgi:hypothetical protein
MSLCGTEEEVEPDAAAPLWPLVEGLALWSVELGEVELCEDELEGEVDCEEEDDGEVALWSDCGIVEVELLLEDGLELLLGLVDDELLEGDVLCELLLEGDVLCEVLLEGDVLWELLLEDDGLVVLWSDCGIADEFELLLEGEPLVEELPLTDEFDWLLVAGLVDWSLLLVLGAAELEAEDDGAWLLEDGNWSELCGWAAVGFCAGLCWAAGVCVWSGKVFGVVGAWVAVLWASAKPALIASTIPSL